MKNFFSHPDVSFSPPASIYAPKPISFEKFGKHLSIMF
jgi:hypothetical protein